MKKASYYIKFFILFVAIFLSSCLSRHEDHGYIFEGVNEEVLNNGSASQREVRMIMGSPSLITRHNDGENWFYWSGNVKKLLFFKSRVVKRRVLVVKFMKNGLIKDSVNYDFDDQREYSFNKNRTAVNNDKESLWKAIFGNIGHVTPQ